MNTVLPLARGLAAFALALASFALSAPVLAQGYPSQPVKILVGFPPGGTTDVMARLAAQELGVQTGKTFVVENRPGASGSIAAAAVAKSAPDGHTLVMVPSTYGTAGALYASLPYSDSELTPVGLIGSTPYVFVVHPSITAVTFSDLIRLLKQNPGKYEFASSSPGTAQHLGGELVKRMAGVDMLHVPYKGSGALLPDLLSGRVPMMFENVAIMTPHIKKGSLKPLAISSAKRSALLPDVPTVAETGQGLEGFEVLGWFAIMAPAKTPPAVLSFLNAELNRMLTKPAIVTRFHELGAEPMGGTPEQAAAYIQAEQEKWGKVIREAGIKAQ
ncbi:MAG: tripartite tricarboxylate transporter substrate binding protein [Pseudomonadota bacterium]|nr:tripartite tricarboxylate transporter substrate binding protein [Pseudomonadota bacterium]